MTEPCRSREWHYNLEVRFSDLVGSERRPDTLDSRYAPVERTPVDTDSYSNQLTDDLSNNGFVSGLVDRRRGRRMKATRRGFLRGTIAAAAASTTLSAVQLFGPARKVEAQGGVVGSYPRRILQFCPPYNANDNCQPGCGSSPICTDCCSSDGFFRNEPGNGYTLYAGGCGDGDIADGWLWRFKGTCGSCSEIEYRCSDGYVNTDQGPAPFICRTVTECVPLADGQEAGPDLADAARPTNWRPAGRLEVAIDQGNSVLINGWIADGSGNPVQMRIRANNAIVHWGTAALPRPDIASTVRGAGPNTGFGVSFPLDPGQYEFCVDALDGVLNATIGCVSLTVGSGSSARGSGSTGSIAPPPAPPTSPSPDSGEGPQPTPAPTPTPSAIVLPSEEGGSPSPTFGTVGIIRRSDSRTGFVSGWAGDPDTDDAVFIEVLVDGESAAITRTDLPRPDVAAAFDGLGAATGYAISFPLAEDAQEVCVVAVSPDDGARRTLGCSKLAAATGSNNDANTNNAADGRPSSSGPTSDAASVVYGGIDEVSLGAATSAGTPVRVVGWSFDPNDRDRQIELTAAAAGLTTSGTTGLANEAAQRIYGVDANCGFELVLNLPAGTHDLTVTATTSAGAAAEVARQSVIVA